MHDDTIMMKFEFQKTRLTIGACWHGRQQTFVQHLRAQVASMHLLTGQTESTKAIECLHQCPEHLQYNGMDEMREGMSTSFNKEQTSVTLKAKLIEDMQKMIRKVYFLLKSYPFKIILACLFEQQRQASYGVS